MIIKKLKNGFTLVEMIVVIAIALILFSVVIVGLNQVKNKQVLAGAVLDIESFIHKARSLTLESYEFSQYGVHFESGKIEIFKGDSYDSLRVIDSLTLAENVTISADTGEIQIPGDVVFEKYTGVPDLSGSIKVEISGFLGTIEIK